MCDRPIIKTKMQIEKMSKDITDKKRKIENLFSAFYSETLLGNFRFYIHNVRYIPLYDPWDAYQFGLHKEGTAIDYIAQIETSSRAKEIITELNDTFYSLYTEDKWDLISKFEDFLKSYSALNGDIMERITYFVNFGIQNTGSQNPTAEKNQKNDLNACAKIMKEMVFDLPHNGNHQKMLIVCDHYSALAFAVLAYFTHKTDFDVKFEYTFDGIRKRIEHKHSVTDI